MIICVIGSSFASTMCVLELVKNGYKPILIDADDDFYSSKIALKKDNKAKIIKPIQALGGLSNFWTGSIHEYIDIDFHKWPIKYPDLKDYYKMSLQNIPAKKYDFKYLLKSKNYLSVKDSIILSETNDFSIKYNQILVNKNKTKLNNYSEYEVFNFRFIIKNLIEKNKINYVTGRVVNYSEYLKKIKINYIKNKKVFEIEADYLFLGSGTLSTYGIVNKSLKYDPKFVKIKTQQKLIVPTIFNKLKFGIENFENNFPLFQLNLLKNNVSSYA